MKNKKGFTLIEIIVVVVIMAFLASLIVPMIMRYVKNGKDEYNIQLTKQLELVGKNYYSSNNSKLPIKDGITQVWLPYLKTNNYTSEEFKDSEGGACTNSYVRVRNTGYDYQYIACLVCENYKTKDDQYCVLDDSFMDNSNTEPPTCDVTLNGYTGGWTKNEVEATIRGYSDSNYPDLKIANFLVGSTYITADNGVGSYMVNQQGKVIATVQDTAGKTGTCESSVEVKVDNTAPNCTWSGAYSDSNGQTRASYPKKGEKLYYKLNCTDSGSGILTNPTAAQISRSDTSVLPQISLYKTDNLTNGKVYTFELTAGATGYGKLTLPAGVVKDEVGNTNAAATSDSVYVYNASPIDATPPSCVITMTKEDGAVYTNDTWTNQKVGIRANCTDASGEVTVNISPSSFISDPGITTVTIKATDIYDNTSYYYRTVKIDKTSPVCSVTMQRNTATSVWSAYTNGTWTKYNVKTEFTCTDDLSGISSKKMYASETGLNYSGYHITSAEGTSTNTIYATDNAGNTYSIKKTIKIDKTLPVCSITMKKNTSTSVWSTYTNASWTPYNVKTEFTCSDSLSGLSSDRMYASDTKQNYSSSHTISAEGTNTNTIYATDNAGNTYSIKKTIKIDKTPPKFESSPCYNGLVSGMMQFKYVPIDSGSGLGVVKTKHCYTSIPSKYDSSWACAYQSLDNRAWDNRDSQFADGNRRDPIYMSYKALPISTNTTSIVNTKWYLCDMVGNCVTKGVYADYLYYKSGKYSSNRSAC